MRRFSERVGIVSFFVVLSRITGLFREMALAFFLGAGQITDSLFVGWSIPNIFRRFFADGLVAPAFVPAFTRARKENQISSAFSSVFGQVVLITGGLSIVLLVLSPFIPYVLSPGFSPEGKKLASFFTASLSFYLFFVSVAVLLSALLNSFHIFGLPASTMSIFNISVIFGIFIFHRFYSRPDLGFVFGVFLGVILQILIQLIPSAKLVRFSISFSSSSYSNIVRSAIPPVLLSGAIYQINFLVSRAIASLGGEKVISYLTYATRFFELPLGVFVYSLSYVSLPFMSAGGKEREEVFSRSVFISSAITSVATVGLCAFSEPIIYFVFGYGKFLQEDVLGTSQALFMYSLGLIPTAISRILTTDFQATGKLKIPVISGFISFIFNAVLSFVLVKDLKHVGVAFASSLSTLISTIYLVLKSDMSVFKPFFKGVIVSIPSSFLSLVFAYFYLEYYRFMPRVLSFLVFAGISSFVFLSLLISLKIFTKTSLGIDVKSKDLKN